MQKCKLVLAYIYPLLYAYDYEKEYLLQYISNGYTKQYMNQLCEGSNGYLQGYGRVSSASWRKTKVRTTTSVNGSREYIQDEVIAEW